MLTSPSRLITPLCASLLSAAALAQSHLLVPSQFAEIGLAVQSANPGDIIEVTERVQPYLPFVIDRPITIVGRAGGHRAPTVIVHQGVGIDIQLAPGERATLSRIDVRADVTAVATGAVTIQGGAVAFEDCRFRSGNDLTAQTTAVDAIDTQLTATFCRFEGGRGGTALRATDSYVAIIDSRCFGGSMPSGDAVVVQDSVLHTTAAWLLGGEDFGAAPGGVALRVAGHSRATIHIGTAAGGIGQPAGSGLVNTSGNPVEYAGGGFTGGMDFSTMTSAPGAIGPTTLTPALIGIRWSMPPYRRGTLEPGKPWSAHAVAAPNTVGALAFAFSSSGLAPLLTRQQGLLPPDVALVQPFITDAFGYGGFGGTLPNSQSLTGATLWVQAVAGATLPLEASPPSAVVVR